MFYEFIDQVNDLKSKNVTYAIAIVTRHKPPISGKRGDKAIIFENGQILGWVGGGCTQSIVKKEALLSLKDGKSRVIRITPTASPEPLLDVIEYTMTCHSGGDIEVYIEPVLPQPQLIIAGKSLVAQTLAKLGKVLNYKIISIAAEVDHTMFPNADLSYDLFNLNIDKMPQAQYKFLVVSTQGEHDEETLEKLTKLKTSYTAFVASPKKAKEVFNYLKLAGITQDVLDNIKVPAGIDINAKKPKEVAVSILAEIIEVYRSGISPLELSSETEIDKDQVSEDAIPVVIETCPTCGMDANISIAPMSEHNGIKYYFCCKGCEATFLQKPESYIT